MTEPPGRTKLVDMAKLNDGTKRPPAIHVEVPLEVRKGFRLLCMMNGRKMNEAIVTYMGVAVRKGKLVTEKEKLPGSGDK